MKKIVQILFHRITLIVLFILLQLALLCTMILVFNDYFVYFYAISLLIAFFIVLNILNNRDNPAYKIAWIILILLLPLFGGMTYLVFGHSGLSFVEKKRMQNILTRHKDPHTPNPVMQDLAECSYTATTQSRYIDHYSSSPPCKNTYTHYLPQGEIAFARLLEAMEGAQRYIFLEYFIIAQGAMWSAILDVLVRKAAEGIDCRVIYDDVGCMFTLPYRYDRKLESLGIQCCIFNPLHPVLTSRFNNRSHRKTASIDGHTAFTGGINLADEYINACERFGHWKDTAIEVRGDAAWHMTEDFLSMWDFLRAEDQDFADYRPNLPLPDCLDAKGFVQPYSDSPLDEEPVGETIYMNLIYKARRYVYIITPYLIVDNEMMTALCTAAKCGVDVRIITPHIPDKWYVHAVTRRNYAQLIESGVRIFEYTPGFIHAKSFVVDDHYGVVGTVNLDYRSLYLHFENGVWLYNTDSVAQIYRDFLETQDISQEIQLEECLAVPYYKRLGRTILSIFSPLM